MDLMTGPSLAGHRAGKGLRVLCVTPRYLPDGGGLARYAHGVAAGLAARGHCVTALAYGERDSDECVEGVRLRRLGVRFRLGSVALRPGMADAVRAALAQREQDVVLVHSPAPYLARVASRAARQANVPLVVTCHSLGGRPLSSFAKARLGDLLKRPPVRDAAQLVAVAPLRPSHPFERAPRPVHVIPPGVDTALFQPGRAAQAEVLFVGPLSSASAWKGVDVLWAAFREVARRVPAARLVLVGDGDRRLEFEQRARVSSGRVRVLGRLHDRSLAMRYQRCTLLALPCLSASHGFSTVLAEANACGRPVVASNDTAGFVVHGENGLLVDPGDVKGLAGAIMALLRDPARADAMGRQGREKVLREHAWGDVARQAEGALLEAARSGARAARPPAQA